MAVYNKLLDNADWNAVYADAKKHDEAVNGLVIPGKPPELSVVRNNPKCSCCRTVIQYEKLNEPTLKGKKQSLDNAVKWNDEVYCQSCYSLKRICVVCATPFISRTYNKKTCSPGCAISHYRARQKNNQTRYRELAREVECSFDAAKFETKGRVKS